MPKLLLLPPSGIYWEWTSLLSFSKDFCGEDAKELNPYLAGFAIWQSTVLFYLFGGGGSVGWAACQLIAGSVVWSPASPGQTPLDETHNSQTALFEWQLCQCVCAECIHWTCKAQQPVKTWSFGSSVHHLILQVTTYSFRGWNHGCIIRTGCWIETWDQFVLILPDSRG